jgi:hypothetical protein
LIGEKGGLNVKDYPFAFSIAALLFPQILQDGNQLSSILSITLIGGMLGSILTIINPIERVIRWIYEKTSFVNVYPKMHEKNRLVKQILKKNFKAALSSPSISYENEKMVGIVYFLVVLLIAMVRTFYNDFSNTLNLADIELTGLRFGSVIGFITVFIVLIYNINGFIIRKSKKSISHLDRIRCVTIANLAVDFANISNEGQRWDRYVTNDARMAPLVCTELSRLENSKINTLDEFIANFHVDRIRKYYQLYEHGWDEDHNPRFLYAAFRSAGEASLRYDVTLSESLTWFEYPQYLGPTEFDIPISQLQSSIESRDWYNATLKTYRITDRLEDFLASKKLQEKISIPNKPS